MKVTVYHLTIPDNIRAQNEPAVESIRGFISGGREHFVKEVFERGHMQHLSYYEKVADVNVPDLEDAFRVTNHIDEHWTQNPEVEHMYVKHPRSTSVGDVLIEGNGKRWFVDSFGMKVF